jgi:hypothetical protein
MLHAGAKPFDYDGLRALSVPEPTATHVPIPHHRVVDLVAHSLSYYGHEITESQFGVTEDGMRFFGVLSLRSPYTGYEDTVGLRNSHDKKFPIGVSFGSRVFVCDNLAFIADHVIRRKHTAHAKRDLPGMIAELIEPLTVEREKQHQKLLAYQASPLTQQGADHAIMSLYRGGIIGVQKIAEVHEQWQHPEFDWGPPTAWRLFNAATFALKGKAVEQTDLTTRLHRVIDGVCERVH